MGMSVHEGVTRGKGRIEKKERISIACFVYYANLTGQEDKQERLCILERVTLEKKNPFLTSRTTLCMLTEIQIIQTEHHMSLPLRLKHFI